jgi:hypothetical protein
MSTWFSTFYVYIFLLFQKKLWFCMDMIISLFTCQYLSSFRRLSTGTSINSPFQVPCCFHLSFVQFNIFLPATLLYMSMNGQSYEIFIGRMLFQYNIHMLLFYVNKYENISLRWHAGLELCFSFNVFSDILFLST